MYVYVQIRKDFIEMLRERGDSIDRHCRWHDIKKKFEMDSRYRAVENSMYREEYFHDFLRILKEEKRRREKEREKEREQRERERERERERKSDRKSDRKDKERRERSRSRTKDRSDRDGKDRGSKEKEKERKDKSDKEKDDKKKNKDYVSSLFYITLIFYVVTLCFYIFFLYRRKESIIPKKTIPLPVIVMRRKKPNVYKKNVIASLEPNKV